MQTQVSRAVIKDARAILTSVTDEAYGAAVGDGVADDTNPVINAVADAYATGAVLYWPPGTYLTTASIPNFHDVRHFGTGVVARGSDTFPIYQQTGTTNVLYISASGNDANDGLTSSQPLDTLARAFVILNRYGPVLEGKWRIKLASGTYTEITEYPRGLQSRKLVEIQATTSPGASPAVPTVIFDGSGKGTSPAIEIDRDSRLEIKDIKFQDYNGSVISAAYNNLISLRNVHTENCGLSNSYPYDVALFNGLYISGGLNTDTTGTGAGMVRSLAHNWLDFGYYYNEDTGNGVSDGSLAAGPQFSTTVGGLIGINASENTRGHIEYTTLDGFTYNIAVAVQSRIHAAHCDIKNATVKGVWVGMGGEFFDNTNTYSGNAGSVNIDVNAFGRDTQRMDPQAKTAIEKDLIVAWNSTATTSAQILGIPYVFTGTEFNVGDSIEVTIWGTIVGTAGTKLLALRHGANAINGAAALLPATPAGVYKAVLKVTATGASAQTGSAIGIINGGVPFVGRSTDTEPINNGTGQNLYLYLTLGSAADTLSVTEVHYKRLG